jgi:hypothetical protein
MYVYIKDTPLLYITHDIYHSHKLEQHHSTQWKSQLPRESIRTSLLGWSLQGSMFIINQTAIQNGPEMFCTTLRRRLSYASALPSLITTDGLSLQGT